MIYPCPYCETNLELQPEHIGRRITCPACNRSFIADDLPPVTIAAKTPPQKSGSSFGNIFKIVFYVFLAIFLLGLIITIVFGVIQFTTAPTINEKVQSAVESLESTSPQTSPQTRQQTSTLTPFNLSEKERKSAETLRELDAEANALEE